MREKYIATLTLIALLFGMAQAQVIFDPAVYPSENLSTGMSIVDIDGTAYLKVVTNAWNTSIIMAEDITIAPGHTRFTTEVKYEVGTSGFTLDQINTWFKLANADLDDVVIKGQASTTEFNEFIIEDIPEGAVVHTLQFTGQESVGWSAVTGDTMYIGRVTVEYPGAILDPAVAVQEYLSTGWSVVTIDDEAYFRIVLDGWNSFWEFSNNIGSYIIPDDVTAIKTMSKYAEGTSGFAVGDVNTFLKFSDPNQTEVIANGNASSIDFIKHNAAIVPGAEIGIFQVAGQETTGLDAITGDTLWVGMFLPDMVEGIAIESDGGATTIDVIDGTLQLIAVVTPDDAFNTAVTWEVSDALLASVDANGLLTADDDGDVSVTATTTDGTDLSAEIMITISGQYVGVSNSVSKTIKMYPNPVEDILYIENAADASSIDIFDMSGKLMMSVSNLNNNMSVDVSGLSNGIYVVRTYQEEGVQTFKLVK